MVPPNSRGVEAKEADAVPRLRAGRAFDSRLRGRRKVRAGRLKLNATAENAERLCHRVAPAFEAQCTRVKAKTRVPGHAQTGTAKLARRQSTVRLKLGEAQAAAGREARPRVSDRYLQI